MIGDWVFNENTPCKVFSIWNKGIGVRNVDLAYEVEGVWVFMELSPIPLTAEILEKNGCIMVDKGDYGEWHIKENPNIPLWQHTEFVIFGGIEIHFVHELQHALRLCGLNDIADNFKI